MKRVAAALLAALVASAGRSEAGPETGAPVYYVLDQRIRRVGADGTGDRALELPYATAAKLAVDPVRRRLAFVEGVVPAALVVATDDAVLRRVPLPVDLHRIVRVRWSPRGDRIAVEGDGGGPLESHRVRVLDVERGTLSPLGAPTAADLDPSWSPDGERIAVIAVTRRWEKRRSDVHEQFWDGAVEVVHVSSGERRRLVPPALRLLGTAWSPDGRFVAYSSPTHVHLVAVGGGAARAVIAGDVSHGPTWTPDGRILATVPRYDVVPPSPEEVGTVRTDVVLVHPAGGAPRSFRVGDLQDLAISPDGAHLALVHAFDRVVRTALDGTGPTTLARRPAPPPKDRISILTEVAWGPEP